MAHLVPQASLRANPAPSHQPKNTTPYAGIFDLGSIDAAAAYRITISQDAWIDVVQDGKVLHQTGFTGSKTCPEIRKSVRFDLNKGPARIMLSDAAQEQLNLEVLPGLP